MSFHDVSRRALARAITLMASPLPVVYEGNSYSAIVAELSESDSLALGGFEQKLSCIVQVGADFPNPIKGKRLTVNGKERRIVMIGADPLGWKLTLEDINR
jgi:hypothetical protein